MKDYNNNRLFNPAHAKAEHYRLELEGLERRLSEQTRACLEAAMAAKRARQRQAYERFMGPQRSTP